MLPGAGLFGDSITVLLDKVINQLLSTNYIFATWKPRNLHMAILKHIHLDPLANEGERHEDRILAVARHSKMNVGVLKLSKQAVERVGHTYAERKGQRREPAADDVEFVSERIGWLPFAAPSCSEIVALVLGSA